MTAYTRPVRRPLLVVIPLVVAVFVAAGCGSGGDSDTPPPQPQPSARPADFPHGTGRTIQELQHMGGRSLVFAPSVQDLRRGMNRYGFALFDSARKQVTGAEVALYTARADGSHVHGPYIARSESLKVAGVFQSRTTASDPNSAKAVYVADVPFHHTGQQVVTAMAKLDGRLINTNPFSVEVSDGHGGGPPWPGQKAIRVHTLTMADVGGNASRIDTRLPPADDLLETDLADVLGRRPVVITFATPLLCQSRVCGPVVDIVEQVKARSPSDIAFIHQEIYNGNQIDKGVRPQVAAWHLRSEPWTFVIDRSGRISTRFEGAFSAGELERAIAKVA
jgi:hypothetical protein